MGNITDLTSIIVQRQSEFTQKQTSITTQKLSLPRSSYMFLSSLCVHPDKQGQGLGRRLVKHIIDKVRTTSYLSIDHPKFTRSCYEQGDAESRTVWLVSGNVSNTEFYEKCGFVIVGECSLGGDNPTWNEPPLIIRTVCSIFIEEHCVLIVRVQMIREMKKSAQYG